MFNKVIKQLGTNVYIKDNQVKSMSLYIFTKKCDIFKPLEIIQFYRLDAKKKSKLTIMNDGYSKN